MERKPPQIVERPRKRKFPLTEGSKNAIAMRRGQRRDALGRILGLLESELEVYMDGLKEARKLLEEMDQ